MRSSPFECRLELSATIKSRNPATAREAFIDLLIGGGLFNPDLDKGRISVKRVSEKGVARKP